MVSLTLQAQILCLIEEAAPLNPRAVPLCHWAAFCHHGTSPVSPLDFSPPQLSQQPPQVSNQAFDAHWSKQLR